jgi:hypothetical protein
VVAMMLCVSSTGEPCLKIAMGMSLVDPLVLVGSLVLRELGFKVRFVLLCFDADVRGSSNVATQPP